MSSNITWSKIPEVTLFCFSLFYISPVSKINIIYSSNCNLFVFITNEFGIIFQQNNQIINLSSLTHLFLYPSQLRLTLKPNQVITYENEHPSENNTNQV